MTTLNHWLDIYAPFALAVALVGVLYKVGLHLVRVVSRPRPPRRSANALDNPPTFGFFTALRRAMVFPTRRFSMRSNPVYALGAMLYHVGIVGVSAGYALSVVLLGIHLARHDIVPNIALGVAASHDTSPSNLFAIVFGNGEPLQSAFLFGPLARTFVFLSWIVVACAFVGNTLLLLTHLLGRSGAIRGDIDPAAKGLRVKGKVSASHLAVTGLVYAIIWTEILARLDVVPSIVFLHATLGATLVLVMPYTYLFHMIYGPVGVYYATRRWQARTIA